MTSRAVPTRFVDGLHATSGWTRMRAHADIRSARAIDAAMSRAGLVKPVAFVSGFWRSGTTWLQECLADMLDAKTVFEPLSPLNPERRATVARLFGADEDAAQAYIPDEEHAGDDVLACLDPAMQGRATNSFTLSCRSSVAQSLRRRVVVKDVRAQCQLALINARYRVPVIHVRRHPCAVVSSLVRANWHWRFARTSLATLFSRSTLRADLAADLRGFDADEVSRTAFTWAWSERCAAKQIAGHPWGRTVIYEHLVGNPPRVFAALCASLGLSVRGDVAFDTPSASIHPAEYEARGQETDRWRRDLAAGDIERIENIASSVFPHWRERN